MNAVVAAHYGLIPLEKVSSSEGLNMDIDEPLAVRRIWESTNSDSWRDELGREDLQKDVQLLGGRDAAVQKISSQVRVMQAWDEGEQLGYDMVHGYLLALHEGARSEPDIRLR